MVKIMFNTFFDDMFDLLVGSPDYGFREGFPASNVITDESGCTIELALAGYKKDQLKVEADGNKIIVSAETKEDADSNKKYHNHRIKRASFKRIYTVPVSEYDIENLKASFEDGILSIIVPLRQKKIEKSKVIMIE